MKVLTTTILFFISLSVFSQTNKMALLKFKKEYNVLEYRLKTKSTALNHSTTKENEKLSFEMKQELIDLETKYGSNEIKLYINKNKYAEAVNKTLLKYELLINEIKAKHQIELAKIESDFQNEIGKLQLKYKIAQ
ncbi:hypothetical protein [Polaribacter sp. P097]|uniref:hypothetical protein n=1 Tax=Polaribacter sp. P097 TaxID=3117398 RepID=UPI002FE2AAB8